MSRFYGTVKGQARTTATRRGHVTSGLTTHAAGWRGAIRVDLHGPKDGDDFYTITLVPWHGSGGAERILARGKLDASAKR